MGKIKANYHAIKSDGHEKTSSEIKLNKKKKVWPLCKTLIHPYNEIA